MKTQRREKPLARHSCLTPSEVQMTSPSPDIGGVAERARGEIRYRWKSDQG
ncbi:hypothetical protein [Rhizobium mongolense]|uniref:hypothetical protein n=1 Tax=Rhizobium mongolense TaxID=57676 RepID=UPI001428C2AD|nr:hypothetical protein [Rhizobium mongolense]